GDGSIIGCGNLEHGRWYKEYNYPEIKWKDAANFIQPPGDPIVYSYMGMWMSYGLYWHYGDPPADPCINVSWRNLLTRQYVFLKLSAPATPRIKLPSKSSEK
ncbi:unnamed protein product, partial [marine sediment metagenome]